MVVNGDWRDAGVEKICEHARNCCNRCFCPGPFRFPALTERAAFTAQDKQLTPPSNTMELVLDFRENDLSQALSCAHKLRNLPVGDVTCTYADGTAFVAERKTAHDLSASIRTGRLRDQASRLHAAGYSKGIFWLIEGEFVDGMGVPVASLWAHV